MKKTIAIVCAMAAAGSVFAKEVKVANAGFEDPFADGSIAGWTNFYRPLSLAVGEGRNGGNALKFSVDKPGAYVVLGQSFPARPGMSFRASVWMKSEKMSGGHPMLCLEWYGEGNRWLGGDYAKLKKLNGDWREEHISISRAPKGTVSVKVGLCATKKAVGKAWFDDVRLEAVDGGVLAGFYSSAYRNRAAEGTVTFFADLVPEAVGAEMKDISVSFTIPFAVGSRTLAAEELSNNWAAVSVPVDELAGGKAEVRISAFGKTVAAGELAFAKLGKIPENGVFIDSRRRFIVDGKPFFPLGMYWGHVNSKDVATYVKGPFNCMMPYVPVNREQLDLCRRNGLKTFCNIKDWYTFVRRGRDGISTVADVKTKLRSVVEDLRDHPALLGWYMNDEISLVHIDELTECYRLVRDLDPMHPAMTMLYLMPEMRGYLPSFDIGGTDPYPHDDLKQWRNAYDWPVKQLESVHASRPIIQAVLAFDPSAYRPAPREEQLKTHQTTQEQMRNLTWQALAAGANGLLYYSFFDLQKMAWKTPFEETFGNVCTVAGEVKHFEDVFLYCDSSEAVATSSENLAARMWRYRGDIYLAIVNLHAGNVSGSVVSPDGFAHRENLLGIVPASVSGGRVAVKMGPFDVCFIRLSPEKR